MQLVRRKVHRYIREQGLFTAGDRVVVAFSGGADSMALVDILANLPDLPLKLQLAHLNHLLRGDESDGDENFVREVAAKYGLDIEIGTIDVAALAAERGLSLEEAGREARRAFLQDIARRKSTASVALGHHRDDQAETVLLRLVRGAAGSGLQGMSPKAPGSIFVRPLLCLTRGEIATYLQKRGLSFREDSSNSDTGFLRNRIRHELLPLLKSYNPEIVEVLNRTAEAVAADEALLQSVMERAYPQMTTIVDGGVRIGLESLRLELPAFRKRLYRKALARVKGDLRRISATHLAGIDRLALGGKGGGRLSLPSGVRVIKEYSSMVLAGVPNGKEQDRNEIQVDSCGSFELACQSTLEVERVDSSPADWAAVGPDTLYVDLQQLPFPWTIRYFKDGDRFTPFGMNGRKKIKDLFIDKKIPSRQRKNIPLFLCQGEIFWVGGVQGAEMTRLCDPVNGLVRLGIIGGDSSGRH